MNIDEGEEMRLTKRDKAIIKLAAGAAMVGYSAKWLWDLYVKIGISLPFDIVPWAVPGSIFILGVYLVYSNSQIFGR